jgi:hypothetical protein
MRLISSLIHGVKALVGLIGSMWEFHPTFRKDPTET